LDAVIGEYSCSLMIAWVPDGEEEDSVAERLLVFDSRYNVMLEYDLITVSL